MTQAIFSSWQILVPDSRATVLKETAPLIGQNLLSGVGHRSTDGVYTTVFIYVDFYMEFEEL
jgi:hypothetical protein